MAGTYLNINSIYSAQNLHDKALSYGLKALSLLLAANDKDNNVWTSLIVSYHTVGQEYEFLNRKQEALNVYRNGLDVAKEKLGKNHKLTQSLRKKVEKCQSLKSSVLFTPRTKKIKGLQNRSQSSNPQTRLKFPQIGRKLVTPTKDIYENIKKVENTSLKTSVPNQHLHVLNTLVREIEKTIENKPRKYFFRKKKEYIEEKSGEEHKTVDYNESISGYRRGVDLNITPNNWLSSIPESNSEDNAETLIKLPSKKTDKNINET